MRYKLITYWSNPDNSFIAEVLGCLADDDFFQPVGANAQVVIQEWTHTVLAIRRPIPEPRGKLAYT